MAYRCIAGIDPGVSGAVALWFPKEQAINAFDMPKVGKYVDAPGLASMLEIYKPDIVVLELVHSMPKQGVASVWSFAMGYGVIQGVLAARAVPVHLVSPQRWKKHWKVCANKEESRALALRLWPARSDLFSLKKHENRAEAALIARYGADMIP